MFFMYTYSGLKTLYNGGQYFVAKINMVIITIIIILFTNMFKGCLK